MGGDKDANSIANFIAHYHRSKDIINFQEEERNEETPIGIDTFLTSEDVHIWGTQGEPFFEEDCEGEMSLPYYSSAYPFWNPFMGKRTASSEAHNKEKPMGASRGTRFLRMCLGGWCPPFNWLYDSKIDFLNAAISGSESDALDIQFNYIQDQFKKLSQRTHMNLSSEWKVRNV